jgi:hypothetical protein
MCPLGTRHGRNLHPNREAAVVAGLSVDVAAVRVRHRRDDGQAEARSAVEGAIAAPGLATGRPPWRRRANWPVAGVLSIVFLLAVGC